MRKGPFRILVRACRGRGTEADWALIPIGVSLPAENTDGERRRWGNLHEIGGPPTLAKAIGEG